MSLRQKYFRAIAEIVPAGAASLSLFTSLFIGSTTPCGANNQLSASEKLASEATVSERLAAIRGAVSDIVAANATQEPVTKRAPQAQLAAKSGGSQSKAPPSTTKSAPRREYYKPWNNFGNWRNWGNFNNVRS